MSLGAFLALIAAIVALLGLLGVTGSPTLVWVAILLVAAAVLVGGSTWRPGNPFRKR